MAPTATATTGRAAKATLRRTASAKTKAEAAAPVSMGAAKVTAARKRARPAGRSTTRPGTARAVGVAGKLAAAVVKHEAATERQLAAENTVKSLIRQMTTAGATVRQIEEATGGKWSAGRIARAAHGAD